VLLPTFGHGGRYQPLLPLTFVLMLGAGLFQLLKDFAPSRRVEAAGAAVVVLLGVLGPGSALLAWRSAHHDSVLHVTRTEIGMARRLRELPPNARIASFDIGAIGYFSERAIIEIGGLSSSEIVPRLWQGTVATYLEQQNVEYVVVPLGLGGLDAPEPWNFGFRLGFTGTPHLKLAPVASVESPLVMWRHGVRASMHCAPRQDLYRVAFEPKEAKP
jgi:hypothetical protein